MHDSIKALKYKTNEDTTILNFLVKNLSQFILILL